MAPKYTDNRQEQTAMIREYSSASYRLQEKELTADNTFCRLTVKWPSGINDKPVTRLREVRVAFTKSV